MNIFFDLDKETGFYEKCSIEEKTALDEIWNYVYDRVYVLDREIEKEESEGIAKCIIIYLTETPKRLNQESIAKN